MLASLRPPVALSLRDLALLGWLFPAVSAAAQRPPDPAAWSNLVRALGAYADTNRIAGASVVAVREGRIVARYHYGFADRAGSRRVDDRTIFHWGSITKTLTAIAVMQLRDRGQLALEDPVTRWIPELRMVHDPFGSMDSITIRMLLTHTAGFQGPTWPWKRSLSWEPFEPTRWEQLIAMLPYEELLFQPGSRYSYSNPGFIYLARIIEQVTGDPWATYVQKNIFAPLGLSRSYFGATPYYLAADRSHGYDVISDSAGGPDQVMDHGADFDPGITIPNSGWNAPLADLAAYVGFLTGAAADSAVRRRFDLVLRRRTLEEMWRPQVEIGSDASGGRREAMGLSFVLDREAGRTFIGHDGSQGGYQAFMRFDPVSRAGLIMVFNTTMNDTMVGRDPASYHALIQAAFRLLD